MYLILEGLQVLLFVLVHHVDLDGGERVAEPLEALDGVDLDLLVLRHGGVESVQLGQQQQVLGLKLIDFPCEIFEISK